ncbi:DUF3857 domain-containing protein [Pseudoxanthomonas gei]|uniref:DUF3857 domain-containing protein n=1 Tax=Pseudoxanthomonas gei TaxID=1383030 RepID=A0ABX0AGF1_9GAMM|nr:DUF3857 domain-containing protein [Pseudoxanthomonas gei]NDK38319.1 DUF3857 domain-containing protein [Pseudoxanthomonas gei]
MRAIVMAALLWAAASAHAGEIHRRGDFQFEVGPVPEFVSSTPMAEQWDPKAPGAADARWRFWRNEVQVDRRAGRDQRYVDYAFEALSETFVSEAGRFKISFNPQYQRLVLHRADLRRDGKWSPRLAVDKVSLARREAGFENDLADGLVTALIVLEDVRVGDVVRISYSVIGSNPVMAGQMSDWMGFAWTSPTLEAGFRVLLEPRTSPGIYRTDDSPQAVIRQLPDAVEVTMRGKGIDAVVDEGGYPAWYQPYSQAQVAVGQTWADVVAWGLPLYPEVKALPAGLESRLQAWRSLASDRERLAAALRAVQDEVRYFGVEMGENTHRPAPPSETWQRRFGDCKDKAYLLATLLQRMGIDAVPALVSIDRGRAIVDFVPSASNFDHVIVRAQLDGRTVWMDPTISQQGGDPETVDLSRYGMVLPLVRGGSALQEVAAPASLARATTVDERYEVSKSGNDVKLTVDTVYEGQDADYARRSVGSQRSDELTRRYSDHYRKRFGELSVVAAAVLHDDRQANRISVNETYVLKAPFQSEGTVRSLDLYADSLQALSTLPSTISRKGPLEFADPGTYSHRIRVAYPANWKPGFVAEEAAHASSAFDYRRNVTVEPDFVDLRYDLKVKQRYLAAGETTTHIEQLRSVREDISAHLGFQLVAPTTGKEREQRIRALLRDMQQEDAK